MINTFFLVGEVKKLTISEPRDPKRNASAVMLIQYGAQREATGGPVEFVNATLVRVPSYKFPALRNRLRVGQTVQITGHLQGVYKSLGDQGFFTVELVADRVDVFKDVKPAAETSAEAEKAKNEDTTKEADKPKEGEKPEEVAAEQ